MDKEVSYMLHSTQVEKVDITAGVQESEAHKNFRVLLKKNNTRMWIFGVVEGASVSEES